MMTQLTSSQDYDFNNDLYQQIDLDYKMRKKALRRKVKKSFLIQDAFNDLLVGPELEEALDKMIESWRI
jgi:hypothetical protein